MKYSENHVISAFKDIKAELQELKQSVNDIKQQLDRQANHNSSIKKNNFPSSSMINLNTHYLGNSGYDYKKTYALMNACNSTTEYEACLQLVRYYGIQRKSCTLDFCFENWTKILKEVRETPRQDDEILPPLSYFSR